MSNYDDVRPIPNESQQAVQMLYSRATCLAISCDCQNACMDITRRLNPVWVCITPRQARSEPPSIGIRSTLLHGMWACAKPRQVYGRYKCFSKTMPNSCLWGGCSGVRAELALGSCRRLHRGNRLVNACSLLITDHAWCGKFHCLTQNTAFSLALHLATV